MISATDYNYYYTGKISSYLFFCSPTTGLTFLAILIFYFTIKRIVVTFSHSRLKILFIYIIFAHLTFSFNKADNLGDTVYPYVS